MKKNLLVASIATVFMFIGLFAVSCVAEIDSNNPLPPSIEKSNNAMYLTAEDMVESLFSGSYDGDVVILPLPENHGNVNYLVHDMSTPYPTIKTRSGESSGGSGGGWIQWGKVCGMKTALKFNDAMQDLYKDKCYQMKAEAPDSDDCRMMYHKPC